MTSNSTADEHSDEAHQEEMFLIEGTISGLTGSAGTVNLLKELKASSSAQNVAAGVVGALGNVAGLVSNAALLESYEGENVQNFACRLGDYIVTGQFSGAYLLHNGDEVKAVVTQRGEALYAHAVLRPKDELLWLPPQADSGRKVVFWRQMKFVSFLYAILMAIVVVILASDVNLLKKSAPYFILPSLLIFLVAAWTAHDLKSLSLKAERIFTVLGFPDVKNLSMRDASYAFHHDLYDENAKSVFYYQSALDAHRTGQKVRINVPSQSIERELAREAGKQVKKEMQDYQKRQLAATDTRRQNAENYRQRREARKASKSPGKNGK